MDFTKPTHDEIKAHAKALREWYGPLCERPDPEVMEWLSVIADSEPNEAEQLYAEAKRLHLENQRLKKERPLLPVAKPEPKGWTYPFGPDSARVIYHGLPSWMAPPEPNLHEGAYHTPEAANG